MNNSTSILYNILTSNGNSHHRSINQSSKLPVQIEDNRFKYETVKETTDLKDGYAKADVKSFNADIIDALNMKLEKDETNYEEMSKDLNCGTTLNMNIKVENEIIKESLVVNTEEQRVCQLLNEAQKKVGTQFSYANVETKMEPLEDYDYDDDDERKVTNLNCSKQYFKCVVENFDFEVIDAINIKVETDDTNDEEMSNDFNSVPETTLNMNIKLEDEVIEESQVVNMEEHEIHQLSNEAGDEPSQVNAGTEVDPLEVYIDDNEPQAASPSCAQKSFECCVCNQKFAKKLILLAHFREVHSDVKPYLCDFCEKVFSDTSALNTHKQIHTGEKPYKCDLCEKAFSVKPAYSAHRRIHTDQKEIYKCDLCGKSFSYKSNFETHSSNCGEKPYKCDVCGKLFSHKSTYDRHVRTHTGEKPYKCDVCAKAFKQISSYDRHTRIHTGEKPYKCDLCSKAFSQKSSCDLHRRIHTGEKPFKCDLCAKSFSVKSNFDTHRRIHTGEKLYKCEICAKVFLRKSTYLRHRRSVHSVEKVIWHVIINEQPL